MEITIANIWKCPKCNSEEIEEIMTDITASSRVEYVHIDNDGFIEFERIYDEFDGGIIDRYQCRNCGHKIAESMDELVELLKEKEENKMQNNNILDIMIEEADGPLDPSTKDKNPEYTRGMCELIARTSMRLGINYEDTTTGAVNIGKQIGIKDPYGLFYEIPYRPIRDNYIGGVCPDCGDNIPNNIEGGESCFNCGHVFY